MGVRAEAETLRRIPIFQNCENTPLQVLAFASDRQRFDAGNTIIAEGQEGRSAYFVLDGLVSVTRGAELIAKAEPGALLGETAMLGSARYMVTAKADTIVYTARIDAPLFHRVAQEYPEFGETVLHAVSSKLGQSVKELEQVREMFLRVKNLSSL
jgi:CRP/FNR family transcriptional regulator, cyclic AMP receptor protein